MRTKVMLFIVILQQLFLFNLALADQSSINQSVATQASQEEEKSPTKAFTPSFDYKSDAMGNLSGGLERRFATLGSITIGVLFDFEKILDLKKTSGLVQVAGVYGGSPSDHIGDLQGVNNISAPHSIKLYQAWLQKNLFQDQLSFLLGLHDLNSEFYVTDSSGLFLNNSFGVGPELSRSGKAGPSLWPTTALAGRVKGSLSQNFQLSAAVYDAVPGDPEHPEGNHIILSADEGILGITEFAFTPSINGLAGKYALGAWAYNRGHSDLSETDENGIPLKAKSFGYYLLIDQKIYAPDPKVSRGLSAFFRFGWAIEDTNPITYAAQSGLVYTGLFPGREEDLLGIAAATAIAGKHYRTSVLSEGQYMGITETAFELSYRAKLNTWLQVQPDLQWILHPSMNPTIADAFVGAGRVEMMF